VLARYVRERGALTLPEAVRRMTSLTAQAMRLEDRGLLRPGMAADIVVFDPATVQDLATFEQPHQYPRGIKYVVVNGQLAARDGQVVKHGAGRVLKGADRK